MKKMINVGAMYGVRENTTTEVDFRNFITNGQNIMFLTIVHGDPMWEHDFAKNLAFCEKYNIRVVVHDNVMNGLGMDITEEDVKKYTASYKDSPVYVGQGFHDEPGRSMYPTIAKIVETYSSVYPDKMTFVNLLPMYAAQFVFGDDDYEDYLESFLKIVPVDHLCVDVYPFTVDEDGNKYTYDDYLRSFDIQAQLCRKYDKEFWMYIQSMEFLPNREPGLAEFRFQVACSLAFGATSILHFCYDVPGGSIRPDRTKKPVWSHSRTVNMELNAISDVYLQYKNIGAFTYKTDNSPIYAEFDNEYTEFDTITDIEANETVLVGCFDKKDGNGHAFELVNLSELQDELIADVYFELKDAKKVVAYVKGLPVELVAVDNKYYMSLDSGEGVFITVE